MQVKNTEDVRKLIIEEIDLIKKGESNPARANAISNLVGKLLISVKVDIEAHRYVEQAVKGKFSIPILEEPNKPKRRKKNNLTIPKP